MFSSFKKLSSKVALSGAEDVIDEAQLYLDDCHPLEKLTICERSKQFFEEALRSQGILDMLDDRDTVARILDISMDDPIWSEDTTEELLTRAILSPKIHTPDFHRNAHTLKTLGYKQYPKDSPGRAACNLAMAACSILGASPELPKRERLWRHLQEIWST